MHTATKMGGSNSLSGHGSGQIDARAVVEDTGRPGYANQGLTINKQLDTADGSVVYESASWSTAVENDVE